MRRLSATTIDSESVHKAVVSRKTGSRRSRLEACEAVVLARIGDLVAQGPIGFPMDDLGHPCPGGGHTPCIHDDLRHCWDSPTQPLEEMKQQLLEELGAHPCPYCGINEVDTYDHYLPRERFPEFSATAANLIPACSRCNNLKRRHVATASQRILHPVLDPLDQRLFKCDVVTSREGVPIVSLLVDGTAATAAGLKPVCDFHFRRLRLADRFRRVTAPRLSAFLSLLDSKGLSWGPEGATAARDLVMAAGGATMPNNWEVLMYEAIADWMDSH